MGRFLFSQPDNAVLYDMDLKQSMYRTYNMLKSMANTQTNITPPISIAVLAKLLKRRLSTICTHLSSLVKMGIIKVIKRHDKSSKHWRLANKYLIIGRFAPRYQNSEFGPSANDVNVPTLEENEIKMRGGYPIFRTTNTPESLLELKETNIWEAETSPVVFSTSSYVTPEAPSKAPKVCEAPAKTTSETDCGKPEVQSPKQKTISKAKIVKPETAPKAYDLSGLPENLHPTAIFYLSQTGRTELTEKDKQILCELLEKHFPARIQGEILYRLKQFREELGRTPRQMTLNYIYSILKNQRSRPLDEPEAVSQETAEAPQGEPITNPQTEAIYERRVSKPRKSNKRATRRAPKTKCREKSISAPVSQPVEFAIPVEDAEKVIAEYEAEHAKPSEPVSAIPAALEELFGKIQAKDKEFFEEYCTSLPQNEYGEPVFPEGLDEDKCKITLEDYLRLKYPEAEEEELCRDYSGQVYGSVNEHPKLARLQAAFDVDYVCAMCITPGDCT